MAQSITTRAINLGVMSLNQGSAIFFLMVFKSQSDLEVICVPPMGLIVYVERYPVAWEECCIV